MVEEQAQRILAELQKDGRATNLELADAVGMSTSACWRRVRALEEEGIIRGYSALLDREKAGFATSAILHVSLERHDATFVDQFVARHYAGREAETLRALAGYQPIGRMGTPEEVASLALYLCSDEAAFVTGQAYPIVGGVLVS